LEGFSIVPYPAIIKAVRNSLLSLSNDIVLKGATAISQATSLDLKSCQDIRLLLVDSIINYYKAEYPERSMLAERQHKINVMMHLLQKNCTDIQNSRYNYKSSSI